MEWVGSPTNEGWYRGYGRRPGSSPHSRSDPPEGTPVSASGYRPVPAQIDLPAMEHEILELWDGQDTFARTLDQTADGPRWTFYEGPPTANGMPGAHHIEARVFKDIFPRFRTMQGYRVDRKAGWDCHGLPVELAVEKELGINGKPQIEQYGVEAFNARCRVSVQRHVDAFAELTSRMGYWVNMDEAYWTMSPSYVQSVWWALKTIFDKGWLAEDHRVAPYCPRCGTTLSDHELAQGYQDVVDPSVTIRMPLLSGPLAGKASLLVWTTTPWTLPSNTAVAVHPDVTYVVATDGNETVVVAEPLFASVLGEGWTVTDTYQGRDLEHWKYQRPFELVEFDVEAHFIVLADYVTTGDGTGLVHQSPAYGADDLVVCRSYGLPVISPVTANGHFGDDVPLVGGMFFKDADPILVKDLTDRGVLFRAVEYAHAYPHCWRCHTALLYYAQPSWYIRTTQFADELLRENEQTNWYPETTKWGRYGDWLRNNVDWALSRSRYWGTPLPIWRNDETGSLICVGSLAELSEYTGRDLSELDPHRPFIDEVTFTVDGEAGTYHRVPEVIDAWFDSGSMPFAQWGYPWAEGSAEAMEHAFPADFICEALDQTRGWFYSLMAVATAVFDRNSYRNVLCLGHILAEDGRKMSKHLGNILEPIPLMDRHGADAVRWFMAAAGSPWVSRRVGDNTLQETVRKVLLTYWNSVSFQALYARANDWSPTDPAPTPAERPLLDRWLLSKVNVLVREVTTAFENFDTQHAGQVMSSFIDELSNWYVRRSRRRFWSGDPAALHTLHEVLDILTRLMAPMAPFITERVWQDLYVATDPQAPDSVHLASWPTVDEALVDEQLDEQMDLVQRLVELGRSARADAKVKTRQPLGRILVPTDSHGRLDAQLLDEIAAELNVQAVESFAGAGDLVDYSAKGNFRALGKRFAKQTPKVAAAIAAADAADLHTALTEQGEATVVVDGEEVTVTADEVLLSERPRDGWSVINEQGETVALDLEITPELRRAGLARDIIRAIQEARKAAGFDVSDRIRLVWSGDGEAAEAVVEHQQLIADEVLAVETERVDDVPATATDTELGVQFTVARVG